MTTRDWETILGSDLPGGAREVVKFFQRNGNQPLHRDAFLETFSARAYFYVPQVNAPLARNKLPYRLRVVEQQTRPRPAFHELEHAASFHVKFYKVRFR